MRRSYRLGGAVLFGIIVWLCASAFTVGKLPESGVKIDGLEVGGLTPVQAERELCKRLEEEARGVRLTIEAAGRTYSFSYPEIGVRCNLSAALRAAQGGEKDIVLEKRFYLRQAERVLGGICENAAVRAQNATVTFTERFENPFEYREGRAGSFLDYDRLKSDVDKALQAGGGRVCAAQMQEREFIKKEDLQKDRTRLSTFSTAYSRENAPRSHNIALAAKKINGCVLASGEEFSFNARVGARSAESGFLPAPIIVDGEFKEGVGGGVCQASTTLYNAALLAGMTVTEHHAHSLRVGYVEPSFDAMVSGSLCDLRFVNGTGKPVYIVCKTEGGKLFISFYGEASDVTYVRQSVTLKEILPPEQEIIEGEEDRIIRAEKKGLESEGYLLSYRGGVRVGVKRLRKDKYAAVQGKAVRKNREKVIAESEKVIVKSE